MTIGIDITHWDDLRKIVMVACGSGREMLSEKQAGLAPKFGRTISHRRIFRQLESRFDGHRNRLNIAEACLLANYFLERPLSKGNLYNFVYECVSKCIAPRRSLLSNRHRN